MNQQLEQSWLEWRRNGIGGSDAPVIMGVSPWKDEMELWNEKVNGAFDQKVSPAMQYGKDKEEEALRECENLLGISLFKTDRVQHPDIPWIRGNLDGIDFNEQIIVEIKNPYSNPDDHIAAIGKMVPIKYYPQCMHYFLLKPKVTTVFYFSRYKGNNALVEMNRNQSYLDELYEKEEKFWDNVMKKIPPKEDKEVIDFNQSEEWGLAIAEWELANMYAKREKSAKERLLKLSNGKDAMGHGYKISKQDCEGFLDTKRLRDDFPNIPWDSYRKESFAKWRISPIRK